MPDSPRSTFCVSDLKQYVYCPRIVFYTYCLPLLRPETFKMQASQEAHQDEELREVRRSLRPYGLPDGERSFDVMLSSAQLGLRGRADLVIDTGEELVPVDYKMTTRRAGAHFRVQLTAYGLMLAARNEPPGRVVQRGFIYSLVRKRAQEVLFSEAMRRRVVRLTGRMRAMVESEHMPDPPEQRARCMACEFRRFCNDL